MKTTKKILALLLAVVMVLAMAAPALAANDGGSITIKNATPDEDYYVVKIFDLDYEVTASGDRAVIYTFTDDGTPAKGALLEALQAANVDSGTKDSSGAAIYYPNPFELTTAAGSGDTFVISLKTNPNSTADPKEKYSATDVSNYLNAVLTDIGTDGKRTLKADFEDLLTDSETADSDQEVTFSDLDYGYYYIISSLGTTVTIDSTLKNVEVIDKNQTQKFDKKILVDNPDYDADYAAAYATDPAANPYDAAKCEPTIEVEANSASVGDEITYRIKLTGSTYEGGNKYVSDYFVYDKMAEGLTIEPDSIAVKYLDEDGVWQTMAPLVKDTTTGEYISGNYEITFKDPDITTDAAQPTYKLYKKGTDDEEGIAYDFIIQILWAAEGDAMFDVNETPADDADDVEGKVVVPYFNSAVTEMYVEYKAFVNETVDTDDANLNTATYDNNLKDIPTPPPGDHDDPEVEYPEALTPIPNPNKPNETTKTFDKELIIDKYANGNSDKKLSGAKFKIEGESKNIVLINKDIYVPIDNDETNVEKDTSGNVVVYYLMKDGGYTADAPVTTENFDTPWDSDLHTRDQAWIEDDTSGEMRGATDDEFAAHKDDDPQETLFVKTLPNTDLYEMTTSGSPVQYKKVLSVLQTNVTGTDVVTIDDVFTSYTDDDGALSFSGLGAGIYKITETEAPAGYNGLTDPIYVLIVLEGTDKTTGKLTEDLSNVDETSIALNAYFCDENGNILKLNSDTVWTAADGDANRWALADGLATENTTMPINNNSGAELPSTGGIGTKIFITVGALAMIGAGLFFVTNQRMRKEGF